MLLRRLLPALATTRAMRRGILSRPCVRPALFGDFVVRQPAQATNRAPFVRLFSAAASPAAVRQATDALDPEGVLVTTRCADRIQKLNAGRDDPRYLRITVDSGGCSGFQYAFEMDDRELDGDDIVFERDGARVVIDEVSMEFMKGATVDFEVELIRSSFAVVNNPNVESGCGCGVSFAPKG